MRKLAARESGDPAVDDGVGALQTQLESPGDLLFPFRGRQRRFGLDGVSRLRAIIVVQFVHV
jgi:hypothetical protein